MTVVKYPTRLERIAQYRADLAETYVLVHDLHQRIQKHFIEVVQTREAVWLLRDGGRDHDR